MEVDKLFCNHVLFLAHAKPIANFKFHSLETFENLINCKCQLCGEDSCSCRHDFVFSVFVFAKFRHGFVLGPFVLRDNAH